MPNDMISRSALLPAIESYFEPINPDHPMTLTIEQIREVLNLLPAVDAVEVVRCKDCKHNGTWKCHMEYDEYHPEADIHHEMHGDDDFCSYGVKEDGDSNDEW